MIESKFLCTPSCFQTKVTELQKRPSKTSRKSATLEGSLRFGLIRNSNALTLGSDYLKVAVTKQRVKLAGR